VNFDSFLRQGELHAWLFLPVAIFLGAIHGLEPGHSKTMMAGFIIAIRGTISQAILLGFSAALSHTAIIWALAAIGLKYGRQWNVEATEPYIQIGTGVLVAALALWTIIRVNRERGHHHPHHHAEVKFLPTNAGTIDLRIEETDTPPLFQVSTENRIKASSVAITTRRPNGSVQIFTMKQKGDLWQSVETIPEPHEFHVEVAIRTTEGLISVGTPFTEVNTDEQSDETNDAHARAHAEEIKRRFDGRKVTTSQIILFGLTGGLMPCPAALSILLVCLQLKRAALGFALVAAFGLGLAITMVTVGVAAAWSAKRLSSGTGRLAHFSQNAPYFSSALLLILAVFLVGRGCYALV